MAYAKIAQKTVKELVDKKLLPSELVDAEDHYGDYLYCTDSQGLIDETSISSLEDDDCQGVAQGNVFKTEREAKARQKALRDATKLYGNKWHEHIKGV